MLIDSNLDSFESGQPASDVQLPGLLDLSLRMDRLLAKFDSLKAAAAAPIERQSATNSNRSRLTQAGLMLIDWD